MLRLMGYLPKYKLSIAFMGVCMVLTALIGVLRPYVSGKTFYDEVLTVGGKYFGMVVPVVLCLMALEVSRLAVNIIKERIAAKVSANIVFDKITVTGTENIVMAASLANGITKIFTALN